jgi:hypothetical protein
MSDAKLEAINPGDLVTVTGGEAPLRAQALIQVLGRLQRAWGKDGRVVNFYGEQALGAQQGSGTFRIYDRVMTPVAQRRWSAELQDWNLERVRSKQ